MAKLPQKKVNSLEYLRGNKEINIEKARGGKPLTEEYEKEAD